jgi:hypothetical protein
VKGRLLVVVLVGAVAAGVPSDGGELVPAGVLEAAAMAGVTTQPGSLMVDGETQVAVAPATVGATSKEVTAKPEPMINRLGCPSSRRDDAPAFPLTDHETTREPLLVHIALSDTPFAMTIT